MGDTWKCHIVREMRQEKAEESGIGSWSGKDEEMRRYCNGRWKTLARNQKETHNSI